MSRRELNIETGEETLHPDAPVIVMTPAEISMEATKKEEQALAAFDTPVMQTMIESMIDIVGSTETPASLTAKIKTKHKAKL